MGSTHVLYYHLKRMKGESLFIGVCRTTDSKTQCFAGSPIGWGLDLCTGYIQHSGKHRNYRFEAKEGHTIMMKFDNANGELVFKSNQDVYWCKLADEEFKRGEFYAAICLFDENDEVTISSMPPT